MTALNGKVALVLGVANMHSIAGGCAQSPRNAAAEAALTYLNAKAKPFVDSFAQAVGASLLLPLDVEKTGELKAVFAAIKARLGRLDILVHSIAYCGADEGMDGSPIAPQRALRRRWMSASIPSSAWPGWPSR